MTPGERIRATYAFQPVDHLVRREFYIWEEAIARWKREGLAEDYKEKNLFGFDPGGECDVGLNLGWCEPPFCPAFEKKTIRVEGPTEIIQDAAGRWLKVFTGRRHGFMPDYLRHPVTSEADWEEVAARLDPADPRRYEKVEENCIQALAARGKDARWVTQGMVGGYMYLRALMGPEEVLYAFVDQPALIQAMMRRWAALMDEGLGRIQRHIELDQIAIGEDICYNHGPLISFEMIRQFLLPYYREVVSKARARQRRTLHFFVDTDGLADPVIPLYLEAGMTAMGPFEVASGCDVVRTGRQYPGLVILGGIDKRVLAQGKETIETHLQAIVPAMVRRGGYIPTCDHGVPDNVSFQDYLYYRERIRQLDHPGCP